MIFVTFTLNLLFLGIPEMNILPFEPFYVPKVTLAQATQGGTYKCEFIDTDIYGLTNYKADSFK